MKKENEEKTEKEPFIQVPYVCETQEPPIVINNYGNIYIVSGTNATIIDKVFGEENESMVD